ncbi:hypothetical protein ACIPRI_20630 [Variovorax sp. LARHSF232]
MTRMIILAAAFMGLLSQSALASQTACQFSTGQSPHHYELEFVAYSDAKPVIVYSSTTFGSGKRLTLSPENYSLKNFNQKEGRVDLEFRNPNDLALPPSFGLVGIGGRGLFKSGSVIVEGSFKCDN